MGEHVALGEPAVSPGARDLRRVEAMLVDEPAHRGAQGARGRPLRPRNSPGRWKRRRGPRTPVRRRQEPRDPGVATAGRDKSGGRIRSRGGCASAGVDPGEHFLARHRIAGLLQHLGQDSCRGAGTSSTTLSVSSSIRDLVLCDPVAGLLAHSSSVASGMDSASTGTSHIDGHCGVSSDADDSRNVHDYRMVRGGRRPAFPRFTHAHALFLREAA